MAMYSSFDYPQTCPAIDKEIGKAKSSIESYFLDYTNEICPYIPIEKVREIAESWSNNLYDDISGCFEVVRRTNEDMRAEADRVISGLLDKVSDLEEEVKYLENKI